MADGCQLDFKRWVPEAAKSELQRLADEPGANYPLLKRLASYEVMREVWKKLPAAARGKEDLIVRQTDAVARIVEAWQKLEFFRKHSSLQSAKKAARFASKLLDAMEQTSGDASDLWQSLWPGDGRIGFEVALLVVEQLATFYQAADARYKGIVKTGAELSTLRKKNAKSAGEILFARRLAQCFQHDFGKPFSSLIAPLSSVVFNQGGEGAMAPTIRGRLRSAPRKGTFAKV